MNNRALLELWAVLRSAYGAKAREFGSQPSVGWRVALDGVSDAQIRVGMRRMMEQYREWPPTAFQFREMCLVGVDFSALDSNELVALAHKWGVSTYGVERRETIVEGIRRAMAAANDQRLEKL